jgi:hypothetical protein
VKPGARGPDNPEPLPESDGGARAASCQLRTAVSGNLRPQRRLPPWCGRAQRLARPLLMQTVTDPRQIHPIPTMDAPEFYKEQKWCERCQHYVRFLMSVNQSYCVDCGSRVRLFNRDDARRMQDQVQRHKWQAS